MKAAWPEAGAIAQFLNAGTRISVLDAERSSLFLVDEETRELYSIIAQQEEEIRFGLGRGIAGAVAATGHSLLIPDAYQDLRGRG